MTKTVLLLLLLVTLSFAGRKVMSTKSSDPTILLEKRNQEAHKDETQVMDQNDEAVQEETTTSNSTVEQKVPTPPQPGKSHKHHKIVELEQQSDYINLLQEQAPILTQVKADGDAGIPAAAADASSATPVADENCGDEEKENQYDPMAAFSNAHYDPEAATKYSGRIWEYNCYSDNVNKNCWEDKPDIDDDSGKVNIVEIGIGFWYRFSYLESKDHHVNLDQLNGVPMQVANIREKAEQIPFSVNNKSAEGDTVLNFRIGNKETDGKQTFSRQITSYVNTRGEDSDPREGKTYDYQSKYFNIDAEWQYIYMTYDYTESAVKVQYFEPGTDEVWQERDFGGIVRHNEIDDINRSLYLTLGNIPGSNSIGFNGVIRTVIFRYGGIGSALLQKHALIELLERNGIPNMEIPSSKIELTFDAKLGGGEDEEQPAEGEEKTDAQKKEELIDQYRAEYDGNQINVVKSISSINYATQYRMHGWAKVEDTQTFPVLLHQVETVGHATDDDQSQFGKVTFKAYLTQTQLYLCSYSINSYQLADDQFCETFDVTKDQVQNEFFFYQGYDQNTRQLTSFASFYNNKDEGGELKTTIDVLHIRANNYQAHLTFAEANSENIRNKLVGHLKCVKFESGTSEIALINAEDIGALRDSELNCPQPVKPEFNDTIYTLESKGKPGFFLGQGNPSFLTDDNYIFAKFKIVISLVGNDRYVSLQCAQDPDFYYINAQGVIRRQKFQDTEHFQKEASFKMHQDTFYKGTIALESLIYKGKYVRYEKTNIVGRDLIEDSVEFADAASWYPIPAENLPQPELQLLPVYRLINLQKKAFLTSSDEYQASLVKEGTYALDIFDETEEDGFKNVIGYVYNIQHHATQALLGYQSKESTIYTMTPETELPEGWSAIQSIGYCYNRAYERTVGIERFLRLVDENQKEYSEGVTVYWYQPYLENTRPDEKEYLSEGRKFWLINEIDEVCLTNSKQCPRPIPYPCPEFYYRPGQDDTCLPCDGEIIPYEGEDYDKKWTETCMDCPGGYTLEDKLDKKGKPTGEMRRVCRVCKPGDWIDLGEEWKVCYPECSKVNNFYFNQDKTVRACQYCPGELVKNQKYKHIEHLYDCKLCDGGVEVEVTCGGDGRDPKVILPQSGRDNCKKYEMEEVSRRQICRVCENGSWVKNPDDGQFYCIKTCPGDNQYVADDGSCKECVDGSLYDTGNGEMKCAPHPTSEPQNYAYNEDEKKTDIYFYSVPTDQLDDVSEYGFGLWVRFYYLNKARFPFKEYGNTDYRIAGFFDNNSIIANFPLNKSVQGQDAVGGATLASAPFLFRPQGRVINTVQQDAFMVSGPKKSSIQILDGLGDFSISVWVVVDRQAYEENKEGQQFLLSVYNGDGSLQLAIPLTNAAPTISGYTNLKKVQDNEAFLEDIAAEDGGDPGFQQLFIVRQGDRLIYYNSGEQSETFRDFPLDKIAQNKESYIVIGGLQDINGENSGEFKGRISELNFYNKAFTSQEVLTFFKQESAKYNAQGTQKSSKLEVFLGKHDDLVNRQANIQFRGTEQRETQIISHSQFEYRWLYVYMAQSEKKACYFLYQNEDLSQFNLIESERPAVIQSLQFTLQKRISESSYNLHGFQGDFENLKLRLGSTNVYFATKEDALAVIGGDIEKRPTVIKPYVGIKRVGEQDQENTYNTEEVVATNVVNNLHGQVNYAIYGWFKLDEIEAKDQKTQVIGFLRDLPNEYDHWGMAPKVGERSLLIEYTTNQQLRFTTYSYFPNGNSEEHQPIQQFNLQFQRKYAETWFWVYLAFNAEQSVFYANAFQPVYMYNRWVKPEDTVSTHHCKPMIQEFGIGHYPTNQQQTVDIPSELVGSFYNASVKYGEVCQFRDDNCAHILRDPAPTPDPIGKCVILYEKEQYQGTFISICDKNQRFTMEPNSIYIPEGIKFKLWDQKCFEGLSFIYSESQDQITAIPFTELLLGQVKGMEVIKNDKYFSFLKSERAKEMFSLAQIGSLLQTEERGHLRANAYKKL